MTVATQDSRFVYDGDGTTTNFSFPRAFIAGTLRCFIDRVETFGFSVVGAGLTNGVYASGTVTFTAAPADGTTVAIWRDPDQTAELALSGGGVYDTLNRDADRAALKTQALLDRISRAPMAPPDASTSFDGTLGALTGKGGYLVALKEALNGFEFVEGGDESATSVTPTGADGSRTLANIMADAVNVKFDWGSGSGATGNGSTDDYDAIQAAIDAAGENGVVYFPKCASSYLIGQGHSLEPLNGQTWILDGWIRKSSASTARTDNLVKLDGVSRFTIIGRGGGLGYSVGNHLAIYSTGVCDRLAFIGVKFDRLLSYFERYASNIRFLGCEFYDDGTALGAIATGGLVNQTTGVVTIEPGLVDGLTVLGNYFTGFKDEAIDINCCTINFNISDNIFDGCGAVAGNEVIDVGGACAASATVLAGGSGYAVGNTLTVSGGNFNTAATFTVTSVSGGAVTGVSLAGGGYYYRFPASLTGVATTVAPSGGTGCTLTLTVHRCGHGVIADNVFNMPSVEKRCIRLKWQTFDVKVHDNTAAFAALVTTVATVSSDAVSVEQCDDIDIHDNTFENFYAGVQVDGPAENVHVRHNTFKNIYAMTLAAGSTLNSAQDVDGLWFERNTVYMENIASGQEAIDLGYTKNFHINHNKIVLPANNTGDHCELRDTCDDGEFCGNTLKNGNYGLFANAGVTRLVVERNKIEGQQREAIYLNGQNDNSQVNFNKCKDNANGSSVYAITITDCDWTEVIANQVWDQARGIRFLTGGANNVVNDNQVDASSVAFLGLEVLTSATISGPGTATHSATIASGAITVPAGAKLVTVDTESAGATDDLDTINYNGQVGDIVTFVAANSARDVVFKDGTSLKLAGDFTADNVEDTICLVFTAAATWKEVARSGNGA